MEKHTTLDEKQFDCWSGYWAGGVLTSLPEDFSNNYDGEIAEFWRHQFKQLPDRARILDVCTGNGAVALLAAQFRDECQKNFRIQALDAAKIYPERLASHDKKWGPYFSQIEFVDQTPFESFDQAQHSFDLIFSQYGIEYCDWSKAAAQCRKLIKPGGRLAIVSHAVDTDLLQTMNLEHRLYQQIIGSELTKSVLLAIESRHADANISHRLAHAIAQLKQQHIKHGAPLTEYALRLGLHVQAAYGGHSEVEKAQIISACLELEHGYARLTQMLSTNQDINSHADWTQVFVDHGLDRIEQGSIRYGGKHRVGDFFVFSSPA